MTSTELYACTLQSLIDARTAMLTTTWQDALANVSKDEKIAASYKLLDLEHAILVLSNAQLNDIAQGMMAQEADLIAATAQLAKVLTTLQNVQAVLDASAQALEVVAKIVSLI